MSSCGLEGCTSCGLEGIGDCSGSIGDGADASTTTPSDAAGCIAYEIFSFIANFFSRKHWKRNLITLIIFLLLATIVAQYTYGNKIETIDIKLNNPNYEDTDKNLFGFSNAQLPDYQLILEVNGQTYRTEVKRNTSAKTWLRFKTPEAFNLDNLNQITLINKQLLSGKILDQSEPTEPLHKTELFEYRYNQRWNLF